ncbi:hypothetical protein [Pseudoclavibacter sp. RFBG4]|uniref:hypothetical protein n=1 Tax=Pseudoclavibacter sp. RFBG4 TaxID=2080575 RepID=UPI0011AFE5BA|nr:hypothetical protein [Pseudoclavibacter sp. RFBG4]
MLAHALSCCQGFSDAEAREIVTQFATCSRTTSQKPFDELREAQTPSTPVAPAVMRVADDFVRVLSLGQSNSDVDGVHVSVLHPDGTLEVSSMTHVEKRAELDAKGARERWMIDDEPPRLVLSHDEDATVEVSDEAVQRFVDALNALHPDDGGLTVDDDVLLMEEHEVRVQDSWTPAELLRAAVGVVLGG